MFLLKGKPTNISDSIDLPDMAELLSYPSFQDAVIDDVYKYGTDFHRYLISKCHIDPAKSNITIHSGVKVLVPGVRSCTGTSAKYEDRLTPSIDFDDEWHIDYEERHDGQPYRYNTEDNIVTLLTNKTTAMTQFNMNDIKLKFNPEEVSYNELKHFLYVNFKTGNSLKITPWEMPANRLVTFTNHLHRATEPSKIEFRYMFRLLQTNRKPFSNRIEPGAPTTSTTMIGGKVIPSVQQDNNTVKIFYPEHFKQYISKY